MDYAQKWFLDFFLKIVLLHFREKPNFSLRSILVIEFHIYNHNELLNLYNFYYYCLWSLNNKYTHIMPSYSQRKFLRSINKRYIQVYQKDKRLRKLYLPSFEFWMSFFRFQCNVYLFGIDFGNLEHTECKFPYLW